MYTNWALGPTKLLIWESESGRSEAMSQLPCLDRRGQGCSQLLSISHISSSVGRGESYPNSCLWINPLPIQYHKKAPQPVLALLWGRSGSACPPLGLSTTRLHRFQELLPTLLVRWSWKARYTVDGVAQNLAWPCANCALGLAKFLVWGSQSGSSAFCQVPWSECTSSMALQMSKTADYLGTTRIKLVC